MVTRRHHPSLLSRISSIRHIFKACTGSPLLASSWKPTGNGHGSPTHIRGPDRSEGSRCAPPRMGRAAFGPSPPQSPPCGRWCRRETVGPTPIGSTTRRETQVRPTYRQLSALRCVLLRRWFMRTLICGAIWALGASDRWTSLTKCLKSAGGGIACPVHRSPDLPGPPNSPGPPASVSLTDRTVGV